MQEDTFQGGPARVGVYSERLMVTFSYDYVDTFLAYSVADGQVRIEKSAYLTAGGDYYGYHNRDNRELYIGVV